MLCCLEQELADLVGRLLVFNPSRRLGTLSGGAASIKDHAWFAGFDWAAFARREMPAPYTPRVRPAISVAYEV